MFTINCQGKLLTLNEPLVMGIINITPDSFYEGHLTKGMDYFVEQAKKMIAEGVDILDIGGQSTRPGSTTISVEEELKRVIPVIKKIHAAFPEVILSIDTFYSDVAAAAANEGVSIVNDISAGEMDSRMIEIVAGLKLPYVCMHMQGKPETMQQNPVYEDLVKDVLKFFIKKVDACEKAGIKDILIDPGFGFGKTIEQNFTLLHSLAVFKMLEKPILAGLSRKSTIYKTLHITAQEALNGTTVLNTLALQNGANILRVHDVKEAREAIVLFSAYKKSIPTQEECFIK